MKKTLVRVLTLTLVAVMLVTMLASCGKKLSGSYESEVSILGQSYNITYTFSGSKVDVVSKLTLLGKVTTTEYAGEYEIAEKDDGTMEITFTFEQDDDTVKSGTYVFEEGETFIKIGAVQYNKVEKK